MLSGAGLLGRTFQVRLTNAGPTTMEVDDVHIDPYRRS
jgi:hypothetical protein